MAVSVVFFEIEHINYKLILKALLSKQDFCFRIKPIFGGNLVCNLVCIVLEIVHAMHN